MKLIVGLGNPGEKYRKTRHNIGFRVLDHFAEEKEFPLFKVEKKFSGEISKKENTILLKPMTFMNRSGISVHKLCNYYQIKPENLLVVHDDTDILLGKAKIDKNRSSAGHKGVQSIIDHLATKDFWRVRFGVGTQSGKSAGDIALGKFSHKEEKSIEEVMNKIVEEILKNPEKKTI